MANRVIKSLVSAPAKMVKGTYKTAKSIYQVGKRVVNPSLTNMQKRQMKSYNDWRERHKYEI